MPPFTLFYKIENKMNFYHAETGDEILEFYQSLPVKAEVVMIQDRLGYNVLIKGVNY